MSISIDKSIPYTRGDHSSPEHSPQHRALRAAARKAGVDEEILRNILWLVNASDRLLGLRRISQNLLKAVVILREQWECSSSPESELAVFRGWDRVLDWLSVSVPCGIGNEPDEGGNPNRGDSFLRNPFWGAMWEVSSDLEVASKYRLMQSQFLLAHARYLYLESENDSQVGRLAYERYGGSEMWEAFPESPYEANLRLRSLANVQWVPILQQLPVRSSRQEFMNCVAQVHLPASDDTDLNTVWNGYRDTILSFLAKADGQPWSPRTREGGNGSQHRRFKSVNSIPISAGDPDDPDTCGWPEGRLVTVTTPIPADDLEQALQSDLDPCELAETEQYYFGVPGGLDLRQMAIDSALAVRGQLRHVQMSHQLLPFNYAVLTAHEVQSLLHGIDKVWDELPAPEQWNDAHRRTAEVIVFILIMIWRGFPFEFAHNLIVLGTRSLSVHGERKVPEDSFAFDITNRSWVVPIDPPPYKSVIEDPAQHAHPTDRWLVLQDVASVGEFIETLLRCPAPYPNKPSVAVETDAEFQNRKNSRRELGYIFQEELTAYEQPIREFLKQNDPTGRITIRRLGAFLLNRVVAITGDLMAGALMTHRLGPLTRTERFYASYPAEELGRIDYRVSSKMIRQLTKGQPPPRAPLATTSLGSGHVGARLLAKTNEVERAIRELGDAIESTRGVKKARIQFHNLMTLNVVMLFGASTSCRAIRTPYIWCNRIDPDTGFAYLADKDDDAHHKIRLVWVPPLVATHMTYYEQHCVRLGKDKPLLEEWPDPCYFLTADREPVLVRPKSLAEHMKPYLNLPVNFHRKYMRHRLLDSGCPPEIVMAWLGHAFQGEEIWNPHSSLSPSQYRQCLSEHLIKILEGLGWKTR